MEILDLHGVRHHRVDEVVRSFLNFVHLPCEIITGNSQVMKNIVIGITREYGWSCYERDSYNFGALIIREKKREVTR
jgi:hypothetical protein